MTAPAEQHGGANHPPSLGKGHSSCFTPNSGGCCTKLIDVSVELGGHLILDHINLHVHCGELTALVGPNGAGKSTLFRAMLGEVPYQGKLQFISEVDGREHRPRIGLVPQKMDFDPTLPITALDLLMATSGKGVFSRRATFRATALEILKVVGLSTMIDQKIGTFSGGQLQRLFLAVALTPLPDLLLLDEPISGVDFGGMRQFYALVSSLRQQFDLSVIMIGHDLHALAQYADRMIFLRQRVLLDGHAQEILPSALQLMQEDRGEKDGV
ncbi:MAG: ATP-binding cassette domain-containing protein [Bacteriovoracaceae bacterium]|nr:ATP-binding cassette domain-containing protein [Bacteriovoracaceae bacterium]